MAPGGSRQITHAYAQAPEQSVLAGRSTELARLRELLAEAIAGSSSVALLGGEAGIGNTGLARVLCTEAEARDVLVLIGRASDLAEMPPYGIWLDMIARVPNRAHLLPRPRVFAESGVIGAASSRLEILAEALAFFRSLAACGPLVIVLDDLQWADAAALGLLGLLAREAHSLGLLLLATYRAEDAPIGPPLAQLLLTLQREAQPRWLKLAPLTMEANLELATTRYGLAPADGKRLTHYLVQHFEGNPFLMRGLLRGLEEHGQVAATPTGWSVGDLQDARLPMLVRQVIAGASSTPR